MFDHVTIRVTDREASEAFYDTVLAPLGIVRTYRTEQFSEWQDFLLTGDATGGFTTMTIPEATVGGGTRAYPIDYTKDGLTSFLVLNGQVPGTGLLQLLTPEAASSSTLTRTVSVKPGAAP